jgi:methionyl-tRNA synthetase
MKRLGPADDTVKYDRMQANEYVFMYGQDMYKDRMQANTICI